MVDVIILSYADINYALQNCFVMKKIHIKLI